MGHWFGKFREDKPWRKTPAKINGTWYTPRGEKIENPTAYFATVARRGRYWEGDTGWTASDDSRFQKGHKQSRRWKT